MLLALVDMMCTIPLGSYVIYISSYGVNLAPWISWQDTHFDFGHVNLVPALVWRSNRGFEIGVEITRWFAVFCAFVFFALFGFATEARKHYSLAFWRMARVFGFKPRSPQSPKVALPRYIFSTCDVRPWWFRSWVAPKSPTLSNGLPPAYTPKTSTNDSFSLELADEKSYKMSPSTSTFAPQCNTDVEAQLASPSTTGQISFQPTNSWVSFTTFDFTNGESHRRASVSDSIFSSDRTSHHVSISDISNFPHAI